RRAARAIDGDGQAGPAAALAVDLLAGTGAFAGAAAGDVGGAQVKGLLRQPRRPLHHIEAAVPTQAGARGGLGGMSIDGDWKAVFLAGLLAGRIGAWLLRAG